MLEIRSVFCEGGKQISKKSKFALISKRCNLLAPCCAWGIWVFQTAASEEAPICDELRMGCEPWNQAGIAYFWPKCTLWAGVLRLPTICFVLALEITVLDTSLWRVSCNYRDVSENSSISQKKLMKIRRNMLIICQTCKIYFSYIFSGLGNYFVNEETCQNTLWWLISHYDCFS